MVRSRAAVALLFASSLGVACSSNVEPLEASHDDSMKQPADRTGAVFRFEENRGQFPDKIRFVARSQNAWFLFSDEGVSVTTVEDCSTSAKVAVPLELDGARARWTTPRGEGDGPMRAHYMRTTSVTEARLFQELRYVNVLPETDLVFRSRADGVAYELVRKDGAAVGRVLVRPDGMPSADFAGATVSLGLGDLPPPVAVSPYRLRATFLGGTGCEQLKAVAFAPDGKIVVAGTTWGPGFPTMAGAYDSVATSSETYVARFSADLTTLEAVTFLGEAGLPSGVAVDAQGDVYVASSTSVANLTTTVGAAQRTSGGSSDVYIAKLSGDLRSLRYATYLGGSDGDMVEGLALDPFRREVYVTGTTGTHFPIVGGPPVLQRGPRGGTGPDIFVTKLNAAGSSFAFSTTLGGGAHDYAAGIATDGVGGVYVAGSTSSSDFPVRNAAQATKGASYDAFLLKLNDVGTAISYATYYGGAGDQFARGVAVDDAGQPVVVGVTMPMGSTAPQLPLRNALQPTYGGGRDDGFVARFVATGASLDFATYLGGSGDDVIDGVAIDPGGRIHVVGDTESDNFPTVLPLRATRAGYSDHFVAVLSAAGNALSMSTYIGGSGSEWIYSGIAVRDGRIAFASSTGSSNYPVAADAFDTVFNANGCYPGDGVVGAIDSTTTSPILGASIRMEAATYSAPEYLGGVTVAVTRTGFLSTAVSVDLITLPDTATATTDYTPVTTTINFASGQSRATVNIPLRVDGLAEWNERFYVVLRRPTGASLGVPSSAAVTIVDGVPQ